MEAKELRIGNLVYYNGNHNEIGEITEIKKSLINGLETVRIGYRENKLHKLKDIKPIPLTEEFILNFGFKKYKFENLYPDYRIKKDNYNIYYTKQELFKGYVLCENDFVIKGCVFVHELQNLYFALTNEELTLNN